MAQSINDSASPPADASLGELLSTLSQETMTLVRKEIDLAKTEMTEKIGKAAKDIGFLVGGGLIAFTGFFLILFAIAWLLAKVVDIWLAFGIVGVVVAVGGGVLVSKGMSEIKNISPVPQKTVETLKEDKEWAQRQA
jgi:hypothetical protein